MRTQTAVEDPPVPMGPVEVPQNAEAPVTEIQALAYDDVIKRYAQTIRFSWFDLGDAARQIKERNLWKQFAAAQGEEPFHSFDDYINRRGQKSRSAIYRSLQLRVGLNEVQESDCRDMSQANAVWLLRLVKRLGPKKALTKDILHAATTQQEQDFSQFCNKKLPGAAKEEKKESISFHSVDKSLCKVVDQALQVAMWDGELDDKRDALELIVSHYLNAKCEHEGFKNLSNHQAYQKSRGRKRKPAPQEKAEKVQ